MMKDELRVSCHNLPCRFLNPTFILHTLEVSRPDFDRRIRARVRRRDHQHRPRRSLLLHRSGGAISDLCDHQAMWDHGQKISPVARGKSRLAPDRHSCNTAICITRRGRVRKRCALSGSGEKLFERCHAAPRRQIPHFPGLRVCLAGGNLYRPAPRRRQAFHRQFSRQWCLVSGGTKGTAPSSSSRSRLSPKPRRPSAWSSCTPTMTGIPTSSSLRISTAS